jgi:hypothetical protein
VGFMKPAPPASCGDAADAGRETNRIHARIVRRHLSSPGSGGSSQSRGGCLTKDLPVFKITDNVPAPTANAVQFALPVRTASAMAHRLLNGPTLSIEKPNSLGI